MRDVRTARPILEAALVVGASVGLAAQLAPFLRMSPAWAAAFVFGGAALVAVGGTFLGTRRPNAPSAPNAAPAPHAPAGSDAVSGRAILAACALAVCALALVDRLQPRAGVGAPVVDAALVAIAAAIGGAIGARIEHPGHLLPASIVAASADVVSLLSPRGLTHAIAADARALSLLAVSFPVPGTAEAAPALGLGDLVFIALLLAAARRHALGAPRVAALSLLGVTIAGAASALVEAAVPALPAVVAAVLVGVPAARRVRREDRTIAIVAASIALALAAATGLRRLVTPPPPRTETGSVGERSRRAPDDAPEGSRETGAGAAGRLSLFCSSGTARAEMHVKLHSCIP